MHCGEPKDQEFTLGIDTGALFDLDYTGMDLVEPMRRHRNDR